MDDEPDLYAPTRPKWQHDLRWELETLVVSGEVTRRRDVGRGVYSASV